MFDLGEFISPIIVNVLKTKKLFIEMRSQHNSSCTVDGILNEHGNKCLTK